MCGIFGVVRGALPGDIDPARVRRSALLMTHRGPDAFGQWGQAGQIELAHLRLAIIDLTPESNQPFFSPCGQYVVVFNGEIYNYIELRQTLQAIGHQFRTVGDTEVLLASYMEWGPACV
jgi:asparagine synthase (glutamine-hydrolysing)